MNGYLAFAEEVSKASTCMKKRYGAVIVKDGRVISTGANGAPAREQGCTSRGCCYCQDNPLPIDPDARRHGTQYGSCIAVHAELRAIIKADPKDLKGSTLYLYCNKDLDPKPCNTCDRAIREAGIKKIITQMWEKTYE